MYNSHDFLYFLLELFRDENIHSDAPIQPTVGVDIQRVTLQKAEDSTSKDYINNRDIGLSIREVGSSMSTRWKSYIPLCQFIIVSENMM